MKKTIALVLTVILALSCLSLAAGAALYLVTDVIVVVGGRGGDGEWVTVWPLSGESKSNPHTGR